MWLDQSTDKFHVMADGDDLLGFVSVEGAEVVKLYVSAEAKGRGFARSLLGHAENLLALDGVERAELLCTAGNVRAQNFYARAGWKISRTFADGLWLPTGVSTGNFPSPNSSFHQAAGTARMTSAGILAEDSIVMVVRFNDMGRFGVNGT